MIATKKRRKWKRKRKQLLPRLPLLPDPFLDETFGSWIRRCAEAYRASIHEFIHSLFPGSPEQTLRDTDLDTAPPKVLVDALCARTPHIRTELTRLIVPGGSATLGPKFRDAYCAECLQQDLHRGAYYMRRTWLDAWVIVCPRHDCLMGKFSEFECEFDRDPQATNARVNSVFRFQNDGRGHVRRVNPSAIPVDLPILQVPYEPPTFAWGGGVTHWLDPEMLHTVVGRDLLVFLGSRSGDDLHQRLCGFHRRWEENWHGADGKAFFWGQMCHPVGDIRTRVHAAFLASVVWTSLRAKTASIGTQAVALQRAIREGLLWGDGAMAAERMKSRWVRAYQDRWDHLLKG